jgi:hypothetical protein
MTLYPGQPDVWVSAANGHQQLDPQFQNVVSQQLRGTAHACKASQRSLQQATDKLRRANRDLGETVGFIAASLTTVTAVEAVINIAVEKIGLSPKLLQMAFGAYILLLAAIFIWGAIRSRNALSKRTHAEQDFDQAKKSIFEFCPMDQWPKPEE